MTWTVVVTSQAARALDKLKLGRAQKALLVQAIDSLAIDPLRGQPLRRELKGLYKLRVGDFRIVYDIRRAQVTVVVVAVGNRRDVYPTLARKLHLFN